MNPSVRIPFPTALTHSTQDSSSLAEYFQELCDRQSEFLQALDLACQPASRISRLESLSITSVLATERHIVVSYQVDLSEFQACAGVTSHSVFHRSVAGIATESSWVFPLHQELPRRDTLEEF